MNHLTTTVPTSPYEASDSDPPPVLQRLAQSRKARKRHRASSAVIIARNLRWSKRQEKSLLQAPMQPTLSEDEEDQDPVLPTLRRTKKNLAAFKSLPRPSEVVQEIEAGSAPEAGLPLKLKEVHYRRVKATTLKMQNLTTHGKAQPVPSWSRINRGLRAYSSYLQPPMEDRHLKLLRVPKQLLPSYYRGTLLKVYKIGDHRPEKRPRTSNASQSSDPAQSMVDFMYWATTSGESTDAKKQAPLASLEFIAEPHEQQDADRQPSKTGIIGDETDHSAPLLATAVEIEARRSEAGVMLSKVKENFQKRAYVQQIKNLAQTDDDSLSSEADSSSVALSPLPVDITSNSEGNAQEKRQEDSEKNQDEELLRLLQGHLDEELNASPKPGDDDEKEKDLCILQDVGKNNQDNKTNGVSMSVELQKPSSSFEKEREVAMEFCQASHKRPRAQAFVDATLLLASDARRKTGATRTSEAKEPTKKPIKERYAMKVLKKMGFNGRLGAREDGRSAPLEATNNVARSGLGAQPTEVVSHARNLLSEYELSESQSRDRPKMDLNPVDIDPEPEEVERHPLFPCAPPSHVFPNTTYGEIEKEAPGIRSPEKANPSTQRDDDEKDLEDEWETEVEDKVLDNPRRALIVDMDVIIKDSHVRRKKAVKSMLTISKEFSDDKVDLDDVYTKVGHDLTDKDIVMNLLGHYQIAFSKEKLKTVLEQLDVCYERLGPCELVANFWSCRIEETFSCALLHRGSQNRMEREVKDLGLHESAFLFFTLQSCEGWPYTQIWKDVFCQLGVPPRQGGIVSLQTAKILSGRVAAAVLGARVETCSRTPNEDGCCLNSSSASAHETLKRMVEHLQSTNLAALPRRLRVLFLSEGDNMWYAGCVQFEHESKALVCSYNSGRLVWVDKDAFVALSRANYRKLRGIDFGGLLEPEDVEYL
ncbi:unnamed protein product [Agarophyton chilense]|eukprot:gb/GEZJ01004687.1/.p1 GENE.gb/GEZJ01004687.1/~~gb/GEZJ01004687.1/.p1  ORF type:complete len:930 (-),score=152.96 gb/GEZJ01004687.1/:520-3309(-)